MRSKLFVPGARPDFFAKALASDADALSFDLEDAVPEAGKPAARARLAELLVSDAVRATAKIIIVRVNGPGTPHFADDVAALAAARIDMINLPKCDEGAEVGAAATRIAAARGGASPRLLVNIETPRALARAAEIAAAHPAVAGLQAGQNDLFAALAIDRRNRDHVRALLWAIRLAAGEAGCIAYDGAWPHVADRDGFRAEAELARSLGYSGKSCIHPSQIALANTIFGDDPPALARARRIVAQASAAGGPGAFALDGEMIDRPAIVQAERLLAALEQNG